VKWTIVVYYSQWFYITITIRC